MNEIVGLCRPFVGESCVRFGRRVEASAALMESKGGYVVVCSGPEGALMPDASWAKRAQSVELDDRWIATMAPEAVRHVPYRQCAKELRPNVFRHDLLRTDVRSVVCSGRGPGVHVLLSECADLAVGARLNPILRSVREKDWLQTDSEAGLPDRSTLCLITDGGQDGIVRVEWVEDPHMLQHALDRLSRVGLAPSFLRDDQTVWHAAMSTYRREFVWEIIDEQWASIQSMSEAQIRVAETLLVSETWVSDDEMAGWLRRELGLSSRQVDALIGVRAIAERSRGRFDLRRRESLRGTD